MARMSRSASLMRAATKILILVLVVERLCDFPSVFSETLEAAEIMSHDKSGNALEQVPFAIMSDLTSPGSRRLQNWVPWRGNRFNVYSFGAKGNGKSVDTQAFQKAWAEACNVAGAVIIVPAGGVFVVGPVSFLGPCKPNIAIQLDGKIFSVGSSASGWQVTKNNYWLQFKGLSGITIRGKGTIDGNGVTWWTKSCKKAKHGTSRCKSPTALKIVGSTNVVVSGVRIQNAGQNHLRFTSCTRVLVTGVTVTSPSSSVNTDGFYFDNTRQATLQYSTAATGDDCVGIQSGSSEILIQHFQCGPGHGISIGSLGEAGTLGCVSNVRVRDVRVENALGAVRIKTWQGGYGSVRGISFEDITVSNVVNPIIIDQYYCDSSRCRNSSKVLAISDISFTNIKGTYASDRGKAVYIACSDVVPCTGISMINVNLWPAGGSQLRKGKSFRGGSFCWKAYGFVDGFSSTVGLKTCVRSQPQNRYWGAALARSKRVCMQTN